LRAVFDGGNLGFASRLIDGRPVSAILYRPSTGPSRGAIRQLRGKQEFETVWRLFKDDAKAALIVVVLKNTSLGKATELFEGRISKPRLTETLVISLDVLVEHWGIGDSRSRPRAA
jgi:hypothetical protein